MSEDTRGTLHRFSSPAAGRREHSDFVPAAYPRLLQSRMDSSGANLRFKDPELERKYRVPNRYVGGLRK
jgi:hypothetical protein